MADVDHYLWQAEIFFSMSTKVADPALAVSLQTVAEDYLTKATQLCTNDAVLPDKPATARP
ncbi:MAG: hypothetical protein QOC56_2301 [Alphaproteobacteria bacterium]|nr:hypothetical protein [Alphaproteobacteria bacterium]